MPATKCFTHREFAFTLQNEAYLRYNSFFRRRAQERGVSPQPGAIRDCPVYTAKPKDRKTVQKASFKPYSASWCSIST